MAKPKLTKQGVRNLDDLPGNSRGRVLPEPPVPVDCKHHNRQEVHELGLRYVICTDCDKVLYED